MGTWDPCSGVDPTWPREAPIDGEDHTPPVRSRKRLSERCKTPKGWGTHDKQIVPMYASNPRPCEPRPDHWAKYPYWRNMPWRCFHAIKCVTCGRVFVHALPWRQCPDLPDHLRDTADNTTEP